MESLREWIVSVGDSYYNAFIVEDRYKYYLEGLKITLSISLLAILLGAFIGIVVAMVKESASRVKGLRWLGSICNGYINIIRGTPVLLQLLIIYNLVFTSRNTNEVVVAAICFGINSGAYVAEIVRAGIESIDKGQYEAGRSLGFNSNQTMFYIIMPQAIKNILPALGNEFIVLIKETSVASVIAVTDLTKAAQYIGSRTWDILPPLIISAIFYLIIVLGLTKLLGYLERRMSQGDRN
ncbi:amino acid ABC transporter permease [Anaerocolumna cellulosilytica]|uniref:Amino acid ABC transporter permease n=1 Tax=Anaerocolumna cellulosilytica TaxID=433286 RepID=A0A6S6R0T2_9FIRM|nr:amino acid ABC transporter permease [Anaerocolumna cellulosilytica]MBB5196555.1 His/Glu/Gln/Arg/opine family amino acid ABC transporter permease subunit [Anaerocolumna cellulosilytica]BCJ95656.1 amino acid ABC transporter permease [Anaerocolumna cellulosilytica]